MEQVKIKNKAVIENITAGEYKKLTLLCETLDYSFSYIHSFDEAMVESKNYDTLDNFPIPYFYFSVVCSAAQFATLNELMENRFVSAL